jgi:hypothetical protein
MVLSIRVDRRDNTGFASAIPCVARRNVECAGPGEIKVVTIDAYCLDAFHAAKRAVLPARAGRFATMAAFNVLSIDGGGIRGVIPVVLLERAAQALGGAAFLDRVGLFAGTSTGGLIALGLASGKGLDELRALYTQSGAKIFEDNPLDNLKDLGKLIGADYGLQGLEDVLRKSLGPNTTLGDLGRRVVVTAFDLDNQHADVGRRSWKPKVFHNFPGPDSDAKVLAYKAGLYTSAAPAYFPTADGYIDGGVFAPNPSMCALAQTQDPRTGQVVPLSEVRLLSLGTGQSLVRVEGDHDWGYAQWAEPLLGLLLDGIGGIADFQCRQLLRDRYHRLAPTFPPELAFEMDAVKRVPEMIAFAQKVDIAPTVAWLQTNFLA